LECPWSPNIPEAACRSPPKNCRHQAAEISAAVLALGTAAARIAAAAAYPAAAAAGPAGKDVMASSRSIRRPGNTMRPPIADQEPVKAAMSHSKTRRPSSARWQANRTSLPNIPAKKLPARQRSTPKDQEPDRNGSRLLRQAGISAGGPRPARGQRFRHRRKNAQDAVNAIGNTASENQPLAEFLG